jgi:hypothetical protein
MIQFSLYVKKSSEIQSCSITHVIMAVKSWLLYLALSLLLMANVKCTDYYYYDEGAGEAGASSSSLATERVPYQSSSPGWLDSPRDTKITVGGYVFFTCRNNLFHNQTVWLLEGREDILYTKYKSKVSLRNGGKTIRFGPVAKTDNRISINCEIWTKYGVLPSPLGMIHVISK